jgi:hypothetical protein
VNAPVRQANLDPLNARRQIKTPFRIKDVIYNMMAFVTDLSVDAILGLDFLLENKCVFDLTAMELRINRTPIPLIRKKHRGSRHRRADRIRRLIKEKPCCTSSK